MTNGQVVKNYQEVIFGVDVIMENSVGVTPNCFLKHLVKYDWSLNPTA